MASEITPPSRTAVAPRPTNGPLRVHPENARYFADRSGRAVYLTGSHTWATVQEMGPSDPPQPFDWAGFLDFLDRYDHNFTRLWMWENAKGASWTNGDYFFEPLPWARTGPGDAWDGRPRFDLTRFDGEYFRRLRRRVSDCRERGVYVGVMLFQGWSADDKPYRDTGVNPWLGHPFRGPNNVNGIDASDPSGSGRSLVHTLRLPEVTRLQEGYIAAVLDAIADLDNVIVEIGNEHPGRPENTTWQHAMVDFIHVSETSRGGMRHPVWITAQYPDPSNLALFASGAEAVSPFGWAGRGEDNWQADPPARALGKIVLSDTDHLWGVGGDAEWVWKTFTRGHHPIYMDPYGYDHMDAPGLMPEPDETARQAMGATRRLAESLPLERMQPVTGLSTTDYVLADVGREYVAFVAYGSRWLPLDVSELRGDARYTWLDAVSGDVLETGEAEGGGVMRLLPPRDRLLVLHVRALGTR